MFNGGGDSMSRGFLSFLAKIFTTTRWSNETIGRYGETLTERQLHLINLFGRKGRVLRNVYIPKENGETTEIDLIYVTQKGLFVIESKNCSGWIFGDNRSQYWTSCLPNGEHYRLYNPIKQNNAHIKWLSKYLSYYTSFQMPFFSFIVFSNRCELKKVPPNGPEAVICYRDELYGRISHLWNYFPDVFSEADVENTYNLLFSLTNVSEALKQAHINSVYRAKNTRNYNPPQYNNYQSFPQHQSAATTQYPSTATNTAPRCQRCGSPLVIRTVKEGYNAGKQFYGCSKYPQCKYTQNL